MQYISLFFFISLLAVLSCERDNGVAVLEAHKEPFSSVDLVAKMIAENDGNSFKTDFIGNTGNPNWRANVHFINELSPILKLTSSGNSNFFRDFETIKEKLDLWSTSNENEDNIAAIQTTALPCLRYHFLNAYSEERLNETKYLLDLLVENKSVDLDVLCDAYIAISPNLSLEEKKGYIEYFREVYWSTKLGLEDFFNDAKEAYYNAETTKQKLGALSGGKHAENKNNMLLYVDGLLKIEANTY